VSNRERTAALSAAGLMLIAGCSGGHPGGSSLPAPLATSTAVAMANAARVTLSINVPPRQTQSLGRGQRFVPASTTRKPSYVSPSTQFVALNVYAGGVSIYSTYLSLAQCTNLYGVYQCATNLPYGTVTVYTNLYDQYGYLLSTNMFSNPYPSTIYPNGSPYSNYLYVHTAGVINHLQTATPSSCFTAGHAQAIPLYVLDADGNTIVGPVANPITPAFTAYDGAGLGAIGIYAIYNGSPVSINNVTVSDTSLYSSPYFFVSGSEGAVNVAATLQNIPVYENGMGGSSTYTPSGGYAATGTYVAWGIQNPPLYGLYTVAIQQSINQAVLCGNGVNGTFNQLTYVGSIKDPSSGNPYVVVSDFNNNVDVFDAYVTADYTRAYDYFQNGFNAYGGQPGPHADVYQTYTFTTSLPFTDFFTSANTPGKIDVLSSNGITSAADFIFTSSGVGTSDNRYLLQIPVTGSTRLAGASTSLYYNDVGTPYIYGYDTGYLAYFPVIDMSAYAITGQVYSIAPTGGGSNTVMVRGASSGGSFFVCAFSATGFSGSVYCGSSITSTDTNPGSMQYDPGTGDLIFATGGTTVFGPYVHGVAPSSFTGNFLGSAIYPALSHPASRVLPGLEGVPGVAGLYGGPQTGGPCNGSGEITWIRWTGSSWVYLASMCWPNHYITLTYP
jgi:hypothetical protein